MVDNRDLVIDVEWETDGDLEALESLETRWVIPYDVYNDADGETDDLNMVVCDHLSEESGWLVANWTFVEHRAVKCDLVIDVEWDAECDEEARCPSERWVVPYDAYNDGDGETADLNEVICSYLAQETGWIVAGWTFIEYRTAK